MPYSGLYVAGEKLRGLESWLRRRKGGSLVGRSWMGFLVVGISGQRT